MAGWGGVVRLRAIWEWAWVVARMLESRARVRKVMRSRSSSMSPKVSVSVVSVDDVDEVSDSGDKGGRSSKGGGDEGGARCDGDGEAIGVFVEGCTEESTVGDDGSGVPKTVDHLGGLILRLTLVCLL